MVTGTDGETVTGRELDPWKRCDQLEIELERARREIIFLRQQLAAQVNNANMFLAGREYRTNGDRLQKPYSRA